MNETGLINLKIHHEDYVCFMGHGACLVVVLW